MTACRGLGGVRERGRGVPTDPARPRALYRRGYQHADAASCYHLGGLRERGLGGPKDVEAAIRHYRRACEGGEARGCTRLGRLVEGERRELFGKGCDGGD